MASPSSRTLNQSSQKFLGGVLPVERLALRHLLSKILGIGTDSSEQIDILGADKQPPIAAVELVAHVQHDDDGCGKVRFEEAFGVG